MSVLAWTINATVVLLIQVQGEKLFEPDPYGLMTCSQNEPTLGKPIPVAVTVLDLYAVEGLMPVSVQPVCASARP